MSEIALVSSRASRLQKKANSGHNGAKVALKLMEQPEKFLSTVQIGITLVGIVAGAYGGEAFADNFVPFVEKIPFLMPYSEEVAFILIVVIITYFSLVIGELVPKSIALNNPEGIIMVVAPFMLILSKITYPFVALLTFSTRLLLKVMMIKENTDPPVTEEELKYMIDTGSRHGIIEREERELMHGVFRFGDRRANSLMTHRSDIFWVDINKSKEHILEEVYGAPHSKFPLCNGKLDDVIGVLSVRDIINIDSEGKQFDLKEIAKEPLFVPAVMSGLKVLDLFKKNGVHIGFVLNEYGGVDGLITLQDLVDNIVGEIPEYESEESLVTNREDGSLLIDGEIRTDELKVILNITEFPGETEYSTLGGFMMYQLERIPKTGDIIEYENYRFEIVDMDGKRIDKLLVSNIEEEG